MTSPRELREACASRLLAVADQIRQKSAFVGLDGFVDEIVHVVDTRENATSYHRLPSIARLAERLAGAAGKSTNIELVNQLTKLGGNGPIMANALARLGLKVTYLGALGFPKRHPVFDDFAQHAEVHSIGESGHTDALEFEDGKIMISRTVQLNEINWANIQSRFGREPFAEKFGRCDLIAFVNWTMVPGMSDIWEALQKELCAGLAGPRRRIFFDLADPEKRTHDDIRRALDLIVKFQQHFDVLLGLNEKEAFEIADCLGLKTGSHDVEGLTALARQLIAKLPVSTLVIHPVAYALAATAERIDVVKGPFVPKPKITTGAGDHFNAGFCVGKLAGFDDAMSVLTGVSASGYYVSTATSPNIPQLAEMLRHWPATA